VEAGLQAEDERRDASLGRASRFGTEFHMPLESCTPQGRWTF
jgi:hypothetical protein